MVSSEIFLQGDYVEVGMAENGAFGTEGAAPTGYHPRSPTGSQLGFISDPGKDGWAVGAPNYVGDYFLPGSPQEGWDIQVGNIWAKAWRGSGGTSLTGGLTGANTDYSVVGTEVRGTWEGLLGDLAIKSVTKIKKDKLYFVTSVTLTNTGATTIKDIYFDRTVDPDQEVLTPGTTSDYTTDNKVMFSIPNPDNKSLVTALGVSSLKAYLGLASRDCRAQPYITTSGLTPTDSLHKIHSGNGTVSIVKKLDSNIRQDCGIGIVFKIDSLEAGDSTKFSYAYVLSTADVDSAFEDLKPELAIDGVPYASGDTLTACYGDTLSLEVLDGDVYGWVWSPKTGLSDTVGTSVKVVVGASTIVYTATATNLACPIDPITITVVPIINPDNPTVVSPIFYCRNEISVPLTAGGTGVLKWYTSATTGVSTPSLTPPTNVVGSKTYYVSQVSSGKCESGRSSIEVITRALPKLDSLSYTDPTYCAAADGTITFRTDSANTDYTLSYDKNGIPRTTSITSNAARFYTITGLTGGSYSNFTITNKFGCKSLALLGPIRLSDPVPPGPPVSNNGPLCVGDEARLTAAFVDIAATYSWTGPGGFSSALQNPTFITIPSSGGDYAVTVTLGSCVYMPSITKLEITPTPKSQAYASPLNICEHSDLDVAVLRENPTISYVWSGMGVNLFNQNLKIPNILQSNTGAYFLTAESDNGCVTKDTINIVVDTRTMLVPPMDTIICSVDSAVLSAITNANTVRWSPTAGLSDSVGTQIKARPASTTTYTMVAQGQGTCPDTSASVKVTVIPAPQITGYDTTVRMNIPYTLLPTYGADVVKYKWTPSDSLSCDNCPNPEFNSSTKMIYKIEGISKEGCVGFGLVTVDVFCDGANVTMPNAFSPNGDGNNDIFYVRGTGFSVKSFSIYNRNGQLVFSQENFLPNDPKNGWDGTFGGQSISDVAGFVYMMEVVCINSKNAPELIKGTVLMIK